MNRKEDALNKFKQGFNCAQSVFLSYCDKYEISKDAAFKLSNGFGGGMGRNQEVCGALSGGIMAIGMLYGRGEDDDRIKQEETYSNVRELLDKFKEKYGTVNCKELLNNCNLLTDEGQEMFKNENMKEKCCEYVSYAVKILEEIID